MNLAKVLAKRPEVELHIVTLSPWVRGDQSITLPEGYVLHVIKSGIPFIHRGWPVRLPLNSVIGFRDERWKVMRKLREIRPDIVHGHGTESAYGLVAAESGFPAVVSMQAVMTELVKVTPSYPFRCRAAQERRATKKGRFFMGRTHYDMGFIRSINPAATIFDIPEAINPIFFDEPWNDPPGQRVLFVGSFYPFKGVPLLIKAMGKVRKTVPGAELGLVGSASGSVREEVETQLAEQGLSDCTRFYGFLDSEQIAALHRECALFVLPSLNDNSPNVLAEAMVSGMPLVAHDVGGVASMFENGVSGTLVKCGDIDALADAVQDLLLNREKRIQMGRAARALAERNRPSSVADKTLAAYQTIISEW
jgi:glycosyltransferase involved in cell wall biosynthesis